MKNKSVLAVGILLFLAESLVAQSQKRVDYESLIWARFYNRIQLNDNWSINTEIENRRFVFPDRQNQSLLPRLTLAKRIGGNWNAGIGFAYLEQALPQNNESSVNLNRPEWRPHQELNHFQLLGRSGFKLSYRYRLEERFVRKTSGDVLLSGYTFHWRYRQRLQLSFPLTKKVSTSRALEIRVFDEIMLNFGRNIVYNTFDQNWFGAGLSYSVNESMQLQADFFNLFQQRSGGDQYYSYFVSRFTFNHTIDLTRNNP